VYATVAFCHQRICKADIAAVDVSQACREWGIKTVAVSAGYITLLAGSALRRLRHCRLGSAGYLCELRKT